MISLDLKIFFSHCTKIGVKLQSQHSTFELFLQQGGIIPVNLSTRLTRNLKISHEILVGSPALCCVNKLWAKCHKNNVLVNRIIFLTRNESMSQEKSSWQKKRICQINTFSFRRRKFVSLVEITGR
jgi:hypothetical protein